MSSIQKVDAESGRTNINRPSSRSSPALVALQQDIGENHPVGYISISVSDDDDRRDTRRHQFNQQRASSLNNISITPSEEVSTINPTGGIDRILLTQRMGDNFVNIEQNQQDNNHQTLHIVDAPSSSSSTEGRRNIFRESSPNIANDDINPYTTSFFGFLASSISDVYTNRGQFTSNIQQQEQGDENLQNNSRPLLQLRRNGISSWIALTIPFLTLALLKVFMDNCLTGIGLVLIIASQKSVAKRFVNKCSRKLTIAMIMGTLFRMWFCITWFHLDFMIYSIILEDQISKWPPINIFTTLFVTLVTDLFFIDIILILKMLVSLIPYLQQHKMKCMYQWIEMTGKIYAHILPMAQWIVFFDSIFFQILYIALKANFSISIFYDFWMCTKTIFSPTPFPSTKPSPEEIGSDSQCGICYSNFTNPIKLDCNHIFCKECISTWFDRKDTCPLCRTMVNKFKNEYKDGQTTFLHSLF
uniref:RING-type domain-containing protein n=1 Tax=Strongyloides venezuelensis TaxID=75913 RepID=A0A0K0G4I4_STRVS